MKTVGDVLRNPFAVRGHPLYRNIKGTSDVSCVYPNRTLISGTNTCKTCQLLSGPVGFKLLDDFLSRITPANLSADADLFDEIVSDLDGSESIGISQSGIGGLPDRAIEGRSFSNLIGTKLDEVGYVSGGCSTNKSRRKSDTVGEYVALDLRMTMGCG
jgi:hypothetical protein